MRLDNYLVKFLGIKSRTKAQQLIKDAIVSVDGSVVKKSSYEVDGEVSLAEHKSYVSRSALKLKGFLDDLKLDLNGLGALDIGSSSGGFTQVLLEYGVVSVDAVDVGSNQLDPLIAQDRRVVAYEQTDIRDFVSDRRYEVVVSDISFISLLHIISHIDSLASRWIILLFKPQFEVGRLVKRNKQGVVQDSRAIMDAKREFELECKKLKWSLVSTQEAIVAGKKGNLESLYCFEKR